MQIQLIEATTYVGDYTNYRFLVGTKKFSANVYTRFNNEVSLFEMRQMKRTGTLKAFEVKIPQKKKAILDALFAVTGQ